MPGARRTGFAHGDVLVVLGSEEAIARLREAAPLPRPSRLTRGFLAGAAAVLS